MGVRQVRRRIGETIMWTPAHDAHYMVAGMRGASRNAPPLHVMQSALVQLETLLARDDTPVPFGLLLGSMCLAPEAPGTYLLVNDMTPSMADLTPEDPMAQLTEALQALVTAAARRRSLVIGWYIGGMGDDLSLDEEILTMHRQLFREPWHVLLVHGRAAGVAQGTFLRHDPVELRMFPAPFSEALSDWKRRKTSGETPSAVQWPSYRASRPVVPLQAQRSKPEAPRIRSDTPTVWARLPWIATGVVLVLGLLVAIAYAGVR